MEKRKYETHGEDQDGNIWIVASNRREVADAIAEEFRNKGYSGVRVVEN
jgi:hypothetical protein